MINHSYTIVSIPIDLNASSLSNSDNYKRISLFNCVCKSFDNEILLLYKSQLSPSEMQLGFRTKTVLYHYVGLH